MNRRALLQSVAVGVAAACDLSFAWVARARPQVDSPIAGPAVGDLTRLPGGSNQIALTVDDGLSVEVVAAYADFCRDSGVRMTFFVNGVNDSWSVNAPALRPMVESGQIQLANHTWSHPDITSIDSQQLVDEITRNANFLRTTYGVDGTPYLRPPFGHHNAETDRVAGDLGYPSIALWSGSIEDSSMLSESQLVANAEACFTPGQIVLAHANLPTVTHCYSQLIDIIRSRELQTVTLDEAFS